MTARAAIPVAVSLWAALASSVAAADLALGVPVPIGAGARALGMGGAFTAVADDATANTWNPGGMVQLERPEIGVAGGAYRRESEVGGVGDAAADAVALDHVSVVLPFHAGIEQTVGLAWQRQFDLTHRRREDFAQTVDAGGGFLVDTSQRGSTDESGSLACVSASWAVEPRPGLGIGLTIASWDDDLTGASRARTTSHTLSRQVSAALGIETTTTEDARDDYVVRDGLSATVGAWWRATSWLSLGAVVRPEYRLRIDLRHRDDQVIVDNTSGTATPVSSPEHERMTLTYPSSATLGAALRLGDLTTVALDGTWTDWSRYRVRDQPPGGVAQTRSPIDGIHRPGDFAGCWTVRLGAERFVVLDAFGLGLRVGALWQQVPGVSRATADDAAVVAATGTTRDTYLGATAGIGGYFRRMIVDAGVEGRWGHGVATAQDAAADARADVATIIGRVGAAWMF